MPRGSGDAVFLPPDVRQQLIDARAAKGWTQTELAKRLKVTQQHVAGVECGSKTVSLPLLKKWCSAFGLAANVEIQTIVNVSLAPAAKRKRRTE